MWPVLRRICFAIAAAGIALLIAFTCLRADYKRPCQQLVGSMGNAALIYAVIRAESGYNEEAVSRAGAVGLMQLKPSTAAFVCSMEKIPFEEERLKEGEYNIRLGCKYLEYLRTKFGEEKTVLAAYNAGEGTVSKWLTDKSYSQDGAVLEKIPYPETDAYVKKVEKFRKIYEILYGY